MEKCYNLNEVSKLLGVKVRTLRWWITTGKLKAFKLAGTNRWAVKESEVIRMQGGK